MEDIEYLDEYKDLVLPGIKSGAPPANSAGGSRQRRISSDSSNSSSIDADIFQKLFPGKYLDDELFNEGSGSKPQDRRRRSPSPFSSSDESNDALEALFSRKSSKSKPIRRRERYESFDSVDDLGEALMRPSQRSTVPKPSTSQAGARKSLGEAPHKSHSSSSSSNFARKSLAPPSAKTAGNRSPNAGSRNSTSAATKSSGSINGSSLASAKNKTVTIIKAQKTDLTPPQHEPKTDPLTLGGLYSDSDSDSSYEYESDFYGDRDSEDEDAEPVIDISTDTSRTTSVAEAAKRKLRQEMEKSATDRREVLKTVRRRNLVEEEERPALKRSKVDNQIKTNSKAKFISIIGNETIMSSTKPPVKEARSEPVKTSSAVRKSAVKDSKHIEITKHVILTPPTRKPLKSSSPTPTVKKPLVQTLLSSTLSLHKPSLGEDGSPVTTKKSMSKSEATENKPVDQPVLSSSIVVTKKSLPPSKTTESPKKEVTSAVPRKVNISVSVVPSNENPAESSNATAATPETSPVLPRKKQIESLKSSKKLEANKKAEVKKKALSQGSQNKSLKSEESAEPLKKLASARKALPESEAPEKAVSRATEGSVSEFSSRKSLPQVDRSKKTAARKSAGASLTATARELLPEPDVPMKVEARKSEGASLSANVRKFFLQKGVSKKTEARQLDAPPKIASNEEIDKAAKAEATGPVARGRGSSKKTKSDQRKAKPKPEFPSSEAETASESRDSSRDDSARASRLDKYDKPVTVPTRQFTLIKSVHMTRAASTNRSLAPTPTPVQPNASKELFTPASDQKSPMMESQTFRKTLKGRGRGGQKAQRAMKRKAEEAADANEMANFKRPRDEDLPQQNDPSQETGFVAFPVKIRDVGLPTVDPLAVSPTAKPSQQKSKLRKVRVKINRRVFNKWLRDNKNREKQEAFKKLPSPPPATSETDSAGESMLQPQEEPVTGLRPLPVSQRDACSDRAPGLPVKKITTELAPTAIPSASAKAQNVAPPPRPTVKKTAIYPLTDKHLPDGETLEGNAKKLADQRRVQMFHAKTMPLPVPIPEVKAEPEDDPPEVMGEDSLIVPLPVVTAAPVTPQPLSMVEDSGQNTTQVNNVVASTSSGASVSHLIPSASVPGNPNSIGQTKMFSFLYPMRYKRCYNNVGLDFCCPNLDGPMRAIDFTRLHSTAEVPVLEIPQFLVITTKFISKADKNIPSKVRAKLETLGKAKGRELSKPTVTAPTPATAFPPTTALVAAPSLDPPNPSKFTSAVSAVASTSQPPSTTLDSLAKQLPRGTTLTPKVLPAGAEVPAPARSSMVTNPPPSLIQLPAICPTDKQRVDLQAKVQAFDLVLQILSRRVATLTVTERQRTIEEIVRSSSLMAIDVDVGTKLLENYVHYLNEATGPSTLLPQTEINPVVTNSTSTAANLPKSIATTSSTLSKSIVSSTTATAPSVTPTQGAKKTVQHVQPRSSLPTSIPLYDEHKNIIGFQCPSKGRGIPPSVTRKVAPAATSTPVRPSTSSTAGVAKVELRSTQGGRKSVGGKTIQTVSVNTTMSGNKPAPAKIVVRKKPVALSTVTSINPPVSVQRPVLCKKKTTPIRTATQTKTAPTPDATASTSEAPTKPKATPSTVPDAAPLVATAGMSLSSTSNPNVFIINQVSQPEESILPDSNNVVEPMDAEIKGELDDSSEAII
ncbi:mucin-17 isoform X2 [Drosophila subpulchrella]|uniref:mucin-17 isoform X2 n=1 Tax=Drosophila subpulchrella TaxID=1486046 RepID=UPI0018A1351B|nr:mucin-17 isoform X2 [Drosophila subpulchrella]